MCRDAIVAIVDEEVTDEGTTSQMGKARRAAIAVHLLPRIGGRDSWLCNRSGPRGAPGKRPGATGPDPHNRAAEVPGPAPGTAMTKAYVEMVGRMAYLWGWTLVNVANRAAAFAKAPEPGLLGGVVQANDYAVLPDRPKFGSGARWSWSRRLRRRLRLFSFVEVLLQRIFRLSKFFGFVAPGFYFFGSVLPSGVRRRAWRATSRSWIHACTFFLISLACLPASLFLEGSRSLFSFRAFSSSLAWLSVFSISAFKEAGTGQRKRQSGK